MNLFVPILCRVEGEGKNRRYEPLEGRDHSDLNRTERREIEQQERDLARDREAENAETHLIAKQISRDTD